MKIQYLLLVIGLAQLRACSLAAGQGTVIYDQQSSTEAHYLEGGVDIQQNQAMGQSFTPQLSTVGFVRLFLYNGVLGNNSGAQLYVNLRTSSITGPLLGSSAIVFIPSGGFASTVDFFFTNGVPVTPGQTYYFQPVVKNNNNFGLNRSSYGYTGGTAFLQNAVDPLGWDVWFREGIIVPEPPCWELVLFGAILFSFRCSKMHRS